VGPERWAQSRSYTCAVINSPSQMPSHGANIVRDSRESEPWHRRPMYLVNVRHDDLRQTAWRAQAL